MKVLVCGSESYIGARLVPMLELHGHTVWAYDLKRGLDICNEKDLIRYIEPVDFIINLAAVATPAECKANPELALKVNVEAVHLLNRLRGDKPLLFPNTNIGYGVKTRLPVYDETSPMDPNSHYGVTKKLAERAIAEHGAFIGFRLASLFGYSPTMRWNLLLNFYVREAYEKKLLQIYEGHVRRNFLHVKDICYAFIHGIENYEAMKNEIYNVGLDYHPTKFELADFIKAQLLDLRIDEEIAGSDPDQRDYIISNDKIKATGWKPKYQIEDGIKELIEVLRE